MCKLAYRVGDQVQIEMNGEQSVVVIASRLIDPPNPETMESTIHYVAQDGTEFTDEAVLGPA